MDLAASDAFQFLVNNNEGDSQRPAQGSYMILLEARSRAGNLSRPG
jgi:hypothetical protein